MIDASFDVLNGIGAVAELPLVSDEATVGVEPVTDVAGPSYEELAAWHLSNAEVIQARIENLYAVNDGFNQSAWQLRKQVADGIENGDPSTLSDQLAAIDSKRATAAGRLADLKASHRVEMAGYLHNHLLALQQQHARVFADRYAAMEPLNKGLYQRNETAQNRLRSIDQGLRAERMTNDFSKAKSRDLNRMHNSRADATRELLQPAIEEAAAAHKAVIEIEDFVWEHSKLLHMLQIEIFETDAQLTALRAE